MSSLENEVPSTVCCISCEYICKLDPALLPEISANREFFSQRVQDNVPGSRGCVLHHVVLPLHETSKYLVCREGKHFKSGNVLANSNFLKEDILYTVKESENAAHTEFRSISDLERYSLEDIRYGL